MLLWYFVVIGVLNCRLNSRFKTRFHGDLTKLAASNVSRKPISIASDDCIEKQANLKKRTEAKMYWGVNSFCDWHEDRLQ